MDGVVEWVGCYDFVALFGSGCRIDWLPGQPAKRALMRTNFCLVFTCIKRSRYRVDFLVSLCMHFKYISKCNVNLFITIDQPLGNL